MSFGHTLTAANRGSLRRLGVVKESTQNIHIVLIPGVGTPSSDGWSIQTPPWADLLRTLRQGVIFHSYDHGIPLDDHFTWQSLLDEGAVLLTKLQQFLEEQKVPQPLLFICHGLGGVIVKQALCIAGVHFDRYAELLNTIVGLIFLGTPHRLEGVSHQQFGERLNSILKVTTSSSLNRQSLLRLRDHSDLLVDLATRFNRTNLRVNMLSVYERKVTRIENVSRFLNKIRKIIVVDELLCSIGTSTEQTLGVDLDHVQLPHMSGEDGSPLNKIWIWLESIISTSHENIDNQLRRVRARRECSPSSGASSVELSFDQAREALTKQVAKHESSEQQSNRTGSFYVNVGSNPELQSLLENFSIHQADPRIPCFMVETFIRNKNFFGRESVLKSLDDCLLPANDLLVSSEPDRIRVALLCGIGGLGKTETAIEYAYSRKDSFDAIFWVRAEDAVKLEADIAQIAVRLGIQDPNEPHDKVINKGLAMEWLGNPFKVERTMGTTERVPASWLLIFDNADEPDMLMPYGYLAQSGAVLITSRSPLAKTSFSHFTTNLDIQPFDKEQSGAFVQNLTGIEGHSDEAQKVGVRLGGLPLALAQMAGIIRLEFLTYSEFLQLYDDAEEEATIHATVLQPLRSTARGSISTVWALEKLSEEAKGVLEIASFLDPDCIQEAILTSHASVIDIINYPKKNMAFFGARKQLIGSSLFRHNQEASSYWMHRVTQDIVRTKIEPSRRRSIFSNVVSVVTAAWPASAVGGHDVKLWEMSEAIYQHVTSLKDSYQRYFASDGARNDVEFAMLLNRAAWYQHERGESHIIRPLLELALELCIRGSSTDNRDLESDIRYTLGAVANETNDAATCIEHTRKFLDLRLAIAAETGQVDERLARAHNQMGIAWMMADQLDKAEKAFSTSAREYEKIPNYTKDKRSLPLVNLGLVYWVQGNLTKASEVLELGLRDREELYGIMDNHSFRTGRFLHALGNVRFSQGQYKDSEDFHRRALQQYLSTIRNRHHRTADVCHKVAQHCLRNGMLEQALGFVEQALKAWDVGKEKYAPEIARTSYLRAKILFSAGRTDEATSLFQAAAAMRRKITGSSHKEDKDLQEKDFDCLVMFWSR